MKLKYWPALAAALFAAPFVSVQPALAQAERLYDGVTMGELESMISQLTINGELVGLTRRQTPEGAPYLVISSSAIGLPIILSGVSRGYNEVTGATHGFQFLFPLDGATKADAYFVNTFNRAQPYVTLYQVPNGVFLRLAHAAAGGVTERNIASATGAFLAGLDALGLAFQNAGVSAELETGVIVASFGPGANGELSPSVAELKIANIKSFTGIGPENAEPLIHAAVDAAVR